MLATMSLGEGFGGRRTALLAVLGAVLAFAASPAAAGAADRGAVTALTYGSGAGAHPYLVYVPKGYTAKRHLPLVVFAHGCQTSAEQQMRSSRFNDLADRKGFVVAYPDVTAAEAAQPGPVARCWQFFVPANQHRDGPDPTAIAGITRTVLARWHLDPQRVYLVGMSGGSFMTSIMAATHPDLYAAVAIAAGGAYADTQCLVTNQDTTPASTFAQSAFVEMGKRARVLPRLVMGGDADQGIPPACADKALEQGLRTDNLVMSGSQTRPLSLTPTSVTQDANPGGYPSTVSSYADAAGCLIGQRWLIHGMNHFWPGGSADPTWANWTDPKGPSGAEVAWRFFTHYTKASTAPPCAATASAPSLCRARSVTLRLPAHTSGATVTIGGRRATGRRVSGGLRLRLPAARPIPTAVVVRGRARSGRRVIVTHRYRSCGGA
jgi:poly(hydroxyalkanoate) depolymerase family esterase